MNNNITQQKLKFVIPIIQRLPVKEKITMYSFIYFSMITVHF